jgi:lipopolysaccharide/colanic/teichoic acid biosynthesis glycosyltransferase
MKKMFQKAGIKYLDPSGQQGVFSVKTFRFILRRERSRADRSGHSFSLIILRLPARRTQGANRWLLNALAKQIRIADSIGWVDSLSLGVLLPDTTTDGAVAFLEKAVPAIADAGTVPEINIYSYPEDSENGDDGPVEKHIAGSRTVTVVSGAAESGRFFSDLMAVSPSLPLRLAERAAAGVALLVLSPLFLVIALVIKVSSAGPIFFHQERVGQKGQTFYCYKFRTMRPQSETQRHEDYFSYLMKNPVPMKKLDNNGDERIFPAGRILRSSSLDELPQLINIFKGEMRLVGPRPCTPHEFEEYLPWHRYRVDAIPGLTGLWQVSGKNKTTFAEMIQLDLRYIRRRSILMDLWIILKTIPVTIGLFFEERMLETTAGESLDDAPYLNASKTQKEQR